jgi:hypothetical protein
MRILLLLIFLMLLPVQAEEVFRYYTTAPCGNDWFTRCVVKPDTDGASFEIFHGFMRTPLVESGRLDAAEWKAFRRQVVEPSRSLKRPEGPSWGEQISLEPMGRGAPVSPELRKAFLATRLGQRFLHWKGQTASDQATP